MKRVEERCTLGDNALQRYLYLPEGAPRGAAVLFHGQGDYIRRYEEVLALFVDRGLAVVGTDFPGHGRSPGRRGHIPGFGFLDSLAEDNLARARDLLPGTRGPVGILGHSCGGLVALHTILRDPGRWSYGWISSPLLQPEASRHPLMASLLLLASRLAPWLSVSTGVRNEECLSPGDPAAAEDERSAPEEELFHARITLSWAREVYLRATSLRPQFRASPPQFPLLVTQGEDDPICPPGILRTLLHGLEVPALVHREFPGLRHEPFADRQRAPVFSALAAFLDETLPQLTSPSG